MGEITIYFVGICTHLQRVVEDVPHRVVLVHEEQDVTINGYKIRSHKPYFMLERGEVVSGELPREPRRVVLSIENGTGDAPSYDDDYDCAVFSLSRLIDRNLPLNRAVAVERARPASVYFDVDHGDFTAGFISGGATAARLTAETAGNPAISIAPMDGGATSLVEVTSGSVLIIQNDAGALSAHHDADFLLHYNLTESIPKDAKFPEKPPQCPGLEVFPIPVNELGPGCSNSNYP